MVATVFAADTRRKLTERDELDSVQLRATVACVPRGVLVWRRQKDHKRQRAAEKAKLADEKKPQRFHREHSRKNGQSCAPRDFPRQRRRRFCTVRAAPKRSHFLGAEKFKTRGEENR